MSKDKLYFYSFLSRLLYPPKCCACGTLLQKDILDMRVRALCESCRAKWEYAELAVCPKCGREYSRCNCMPGILRGSGAAAALKLVPYNKYNDSVCRRLILFIKRKNEKRATDFLAGNLMHPVLQYLSESAVAKEQVLVSFVPRGKSICLKLGFDQAENLADALALRLGTPCLRLIGRRSFTGREQKRLDENARFLNAIGAFCLEEEDFDALNREYRCILLVDDVITTGATLAACVKLLKEKFHGRIVCITVARAINKG